MKFSAWAATANPWSDVLDECLAVERMGWDGIWIADHFMPNREDNLGPTQECWTVLAGIAALVPRVRLGSLVVGNTYRHPAVLAKQVAQVDIISGGRVVLGLGAGWQENEHEAYDIPFYTPGQRLRRLEESIQIARSLFENERTTFEGRYYKIRNAPLAPKPVQAHLPILVGGGGEKVTLRIVAKHADEWNTWGQPEVIAHKSAILAQHCDEVGRDPATIRRSAQVQLTLSNDAAEIERAKAAGGARALAGGVDAIQDALERFRAAGIDEFIVPDFTLGRTKEERIENYQRFLEDIAPPFRD